MKLPLPQHLQAWQGIRLLCQLIPCLQQRAMPPSVPVTDLKHLQRRDRKHFSSS